MPVTPRPHLSLFVAGLAFAAGSRADPVAERVAEIRHVEQLEDRAFRFVASVYEEDDGLRYPITTLDRSMVKVAFPGTSLPDAHATSLALYDAAAVGRKRALVVAFHPGDGRDAGEVKAQVAELIAKLASPYLAVGLVGDGAETLLADVTPGRSENVTRLQQDILALGPEDSAPDLASSWCFAAERLRGWDLGTFGPGDQRVVVVVGPDDGAAATAPSECLAELTAAGARVFRVAWGRSGKRTPGLAAALEKTGGFEHRVRGGADVFPALSNVVALLRHEYVVEFSVPEGRLPQQPLTIEPTFTYHGATFTGAARPLPAVLKEPEPPPPAPEPMAAVAAASSATRMDARRVVAAVFGAVMVLASGMLGVRRLRHRAKTTACNSCARRVEKNHRDCPFRKPAVMGRLVVLTGPGAGQTLPLFKGRNAIGRGARADVRVPGKAVKRRHAAIELDGAKALFVPVAGVPARVDGWPVTEPRLLGIGSVLQIGDQKLRFEARRDAARAALDEAA